eukprot:372296-Amphidinium_carterae.2
MNHNHQGILQLRDRESAMLGYRRHARKVTPANSNIKNLIWRADQLHQLKRPMLGSRVARVCADTSYKESAHVVTLANTCMSRLDSQARGARCQKDWVQEQDATTEKAKPGCAS